MALWCLYNYCVCDYAKIPLSQKNQSNPAISKSKHSDSNNNNNNVQNDDKHKNNNEKTNNDNENDIEKEIKSQMFDAMISEGTQLLSTYKILEKTKTPLQIQYDGLIQALTGMESQYFTWNQSLRQFEYNLTVQNNINVNSINNQSIQMKCTEINDGKMFEEILKYANYYKLCQSLVEQFCLLLCFLYFFRMHVRWCFFFEILFFV